MICIYLYFTAFSGGLSKFAKLARSVTRSRSALASQLSNQVVKDSQKQSNLTQVSARFRPSTEFLFFDMYLVFLHRFGMYSCATKSVERVSIL